MNGNTIVYYTFNEHNIMEQSVLDTIPKAAQTNYISDGWANNEIGCISDCNGDCIYRFIRAYRDENGNMRLETPNDNDAPVVAVGIVSYWLHYRQNNNRSATLFGPKAKSMAQIFQDYTDIRLRDYRKKHEQDPSSWRSDIEKDFYLHFIIPNERKLNKQSEALFEYITPDDRQVVRDVMKEYILYLQEQRERYLPDMQKPKDAKQHKPERKVNIDEIGKHFKIGFDKKTYLPILKTLLETSQSDKDLAKVALLIYDSKYFLSNDYRTFSKWYRNYCKYVGCEFHSSYEPSKLRPIDRELKKRYYFLM